MNIRRTNLAMRYMWIAWLSLFRWVAAAAVLVLLGLAYATREPGWLVGAGVAGGLALMAAVVFFLEAPSVRCLGCGGTLLRVARCSKHKSAKKLLGSYTLPCTLVLASFSKSVRCPYCGMKYRISRISRRSHREAEEQAQAKLQAEAEAKEEEARREAEEKNVPYY